MTPPPEDRLDRIEQIVEKNSIAINGLQELTRQNAMAIATLGSRVYLLTDDITLLTTTIADYIVEAEEDRIVIKQNQAHIQQILDYLYNRNGGSPPPST